MDWEIPAVAGQYRPTQGWPGLGFSRSVGRAGLNIGDAGGEESESRQRKEDNGQSALITPHLQLWTANLRHSYLRAEFVAVNNQPFVALGADLASYHFDRHPNLDLIIVDIRQLGRYQGTFL